MPGAVHCQSPWVRNTTIRGVLVALLGVLALAGPAPNVAHADGYADLLDLTPANAAAESIGGLDPRLPTDSAPLGAALAAARSDGVAPTRYSALLQQYWLARGSEASGIDLAGWDPNAGLIANAAVVDRVYENYGRYQLQRAELYWSGMAGLAGGSFAAGFWDLDLGRTVLGVDAVHTLGTAVASAAGGLPGEAMTLLPSDPRMLATLGPAMTAEDLDWYQKRLLMMQKHIYFDMVPMHEAYLNEGRAAIEEMAAAGLLDENAEIAWNGIFAGTPGGYVDALFRMASREQNQIIADQWDVTAAARHGIGRALTYATTVAAQPSVPGSRAPGRVTPMSVTGDVNGADYRLRTPLPGFNWADREPRWQYIVSDIASSYQRLAEGRPGELRALLAIPFRDFVESQRVLRRVPDLARDMSTGWELSPA
ncbi:hypothetical protein [Rhodococcus opacus]|uniref:Tat pathway signal protein n=1 Tax=Rhodococcus opacus (strain B4) TaxID=632772 RepID=C1B440_RHOOB|nr:hypothetical protein [Rhodococcus opacus]BAH50888.1 hypothetical protein ROP_26410 [Rhodococcus opacus B4]